ncbi:MAG: hypothetical protein ACJ790_15110, partial [Myxococcaceae bacterium]
ALTSVNLMPPETLGHSGFYFGAELGVVNLETSKFKFPTVKAFKGPMLLPSVHIRKGLPWSFELGTRVAWIDQSRMAAGTVEVKWALNEGFTFLPDLGIRGYGTRLFNNRDFDLTAAGLDVGLGKQFAIGGMVTLSPYVGWNLVWTSATSNNIDFNRSRTYQQSISSPTAQLQDTGVFNEVTMGANAHNRFYGGLRFIGGVIQIAGEISYSQVGTIDAVDPANPTTTVSTQLPAVTAYNVTLGLDF